MASIDEDLQILDEQTFLAEAKGSIEGKAWNEYLRDVLAEDFRLRRSRAGTPLEGRDEMIQRIAEGPSATRTRLETKTWIDARLGVVVSSVLFDGDRFANVKVFERGSDQLWRCTYWQVTRETDDGA